MNIKNMLKKISVLALVVASLSSCYVTFTEEGRKKLQEEVKAHEQSQIAISESASETVYDAVTETVSDSEPNNVAEQ